MTCGEPRNIDPQFVQPLAETRIPLGGRLKFPFVSAPISMNALQLGGVGMFANESKEPHIGHLIVIFGFCINKITTF